MIGQFYRILDRHGEGRGAIPARVRQNAGNLPRCHKAPRAVVDREPIGIPRGPDAGGDGLLARFAAGHDGRYLPAEAPAGKPGAEIRRLFRRADDHHAG